MSRIISTVASSAVLGCSVLFGAAPARAVKIEDFEFNQTNYETDRPQIHVKFDLQADNWNAVTDAKVTFKYHYTVALKKVSALVIGSTTHRQDRQHDEDAPPAVGRARNTRCSPIRSTSANPPTSWVS